jgi:hypothetical protein
MDAEHRRTRHPARGATPAAEATQEGTDRSRSRTFDGQLVLLDTIRHPEWRLDEATRAVGRQGVAKARAALAAARAEHLDDERRREPAAPASHRPTAA